MAAKAKKRKAAAARAPRAPAPPAQAINVEVVDSRIKSWAPRIAFFVAVITAIGGAWAAYKSMGLPSFVVDTTLHSAIQEVETRLHTQIGETKSVVIDHSNKNTDEVKKDVGSVRMQIDLVARKQDQARVAMLEVSQRTMFREKQTQMASLRSVQKQLVDHPNDDFLAAREGEIKATVDYIDGELRTITEQLRRAREGQ